MLMDRSRRDSRASSSAWASVDCACSCRLAAFAVIKSSRRSLRLATSGSSSGRARPRHDSRGRPGGRRQRRSRLRPVRLEHAHVERAVTHPRRRQHAFGRLLEVLDQADPAQHLEHVVAHVELPPEEPLAG